MFLTGVLNAMKRKLFKGHMHHGKYRYVRPVTIKQMNLLREEYARTDRVMKLLINPYLTLPETKGFSKELQKTEKKFEGVKEARRLMRLKKNVYIEERLVHLTIQDGWDPYENK